jgi:hypothetical protein
VSSEFEWMRIALAMGLMVTAFILLPMYFLWKDKRDDDRAAVVAAANRAEYLSENIADERADDRGQDVGAGR